MSLRNTALLLIAILVPAALAAAQSNPLRPPKGHKVALVVFEDLQCPDCRRAAPVLNEASKKYNIPIVRHDFPLPQHSWAKRAAVLARYFDTHSEKLGNEFREYIFQHQASITPENLRGYAERFAAEHGAGLPFMLDPEGELERKVEADLALARRIGVSHTPTIYVVSTSQSEPFVEVVDRRELFQIIENMQRRAQ